MNVMESTARSGPVEKPETLLKPNLPDPAKTEKIARDFEGLLGSMLVKELRQTLDQQMLFGSNSGDVLGGLFDQYFGSHMSAGSGLGASKMVERYLDRILHQPPPKAGSANESGIVAEA